MIRICTSLAQAGYEVLLVGRKKRNSDPLTEKAFQQKRLFCFFEKGKLFYAEYNIRLFFALLLMRMDAICAIDLDTILPCLWVSKIKQCKRVYDAHELFCEMDEIVSRPAIYRMWKRIERYAVPQFQAGYTIGKFYALEFESMYQVRYEVVRNATVLQPYLPESTREKYILYQGAVNEGRSFETLIPAMKQVDGKLIICGAGNFYEQAKQLVDIHHLQDKIIFKGYVPPSQLINYTRNAYVGITLFTDQGKSNYLSLANRFFDYMHHAVPQLCVDYPEYRMVNAQYEIASLIEHTDEKSIADALNRLLNDDALHARLKDNCLRAREVYCWQEEEKKLLNVYHTLFEQ
ncbi:MAG: glycosyltransferase family 4 protein [Chitinophagaceae bacterium]|nr:glycosyltransferase family 4 protein [Chitinophagaceae bacterium]